MVVRGVWVGACCVALLTTGGCTSTPDAAPPEVETTSASTPVKSPPTAAPASDAEPAPDDMCALVGEALLDSLVPNGLRQSGPASATGFTSGSRCAVAPPPGAAGTVVEVSLQRWGSGPDATAEQGASGAVGVRCAEDAARGVESVTGPVVGDESCAAVTSLSPTTVALVVRRGADVVDVLLSSSPEDAQTVADQAGELASAVLQGL